MKKIYNSPSTQVVCLANDNVMAPIIASIDNNSSQPNENALSRRRRRHSWEDEEDEEEEYF